MTSLNPEIFKTINELGYSVSQIDKDPSVNDFHNKMLLFQNAFNFGYDIMEYGVTYPDKSTGVLVQMKDNTYNNGVYILHYLETTEIQLETVIPNTKDKEELIRKLSYKITTFISELDTSDLELYDYFILYNNILEHMIINPLSKHIFPNNKSQQYEFSNLFAIRFLGDLAIYNTGSGVVKEATINGLPYGIKRLMTESIDDIVNSDTQEKNKEEEPHND